jgi:mono/diheme cytochrome c family protein
MIDPSKPDLEESVNVTAAHDRVLRGAAAAAREKQLQENGAEPTSMWLVLLCILVGLAAGTAVNRAGLFKYDSLVQENYVRKIPGDQGDAKLPPMTAVDAYKKKGEKIFSKCVGCHGADGKGDGANYPPLAGSKFAQGETDRFSMIIQNGFTGPTSTGKTFGVMPAQGAGMSPEDLACVMTYVRNSFGNSVGDVVTTKMAAAAIDISHARPKAGNPVTVEELTADHVKMLPGDKLDPATMVDPSTLEPVDAK